MSLHMLRLEPDMARALRRGAARGLTPPGAETGYLWHALLMAAFGDLAPKPWRLVEPEPDGPGRRGPPPHLLGYGEADGATLETQAREAADPAVWAALGLDSLAVKPMPERHAPGRRYAFEVRLRPVIRSTLAPDGSGRRGGRARKEIDLALHAALAAREADAHAPPPDAGAVYAGWLAAQLAQGGARADGLRLVWRRRAAILRKDADGAKAPHGAKGGGPDVCIAGTLEIADPDAFSALLQRGVGRHRAFGFGMLLLRPA